MARIYPDHRVVSDRTIDSHVKKLRAKLRTASGGAEHVQSVYGIGYRFEPSPDRPSGRPPWSDGERTPATAGAIGIAT